MNNTPRRIAFVSPLGGNGQTTLVANLLSLWSAQGHACLGVDLCAQNSLGLHLGLRPETGISQGWEDCVRAGRWWGEAALENSARVRFVPFGQARSPAANAPLQQALQQPQWLQTQLDSMALDEAGLVLLDAPAWPHALAQQALQCADLVVVCLDAAPRAPLVQDQVRALRAAAPASVRLALLATRFAPRRASQHQALLTLQQQWGAQLAPYVLHEDENASAALAAGHCVCAWAPQAQAAHDINGIAHWLLGAPAPASEQPLAPA
jgi:cellulose synthase operon protein YhjQ